MRRVFCALLMVVASVAAFAKPSESQRFNQWLDSNWEETLQRDPILATSLGDPRYNARLIDTTTAQWRTDNKRYVQRQLQQLNGFDPSI